MNDKAPFDRDDNSMVTVMRTLKRDDDEAWWVAAIEEGLREADAGDFAPDACVQELRKKWAEILAEVCVTRSLSCR